MASSCYCTSIPLAPLCHPRCHTGCFPGCHTGSCTGCHTGYLPLFLHSALGCGIGLTCCVCLGLSEVADKAIFDVCIDNGSKKVCSSYDCMWFWQCKALGGCRNRFLPCMEVNSTYSKKVAAVLAGTDLKGSSNSTLNSLIERIDLVEENSFDWGLISDVGEKMIEDPKKLSWRAFFHILKKSKQTGPEESFHSIVQSLNNFNYSSSERDPTDFSNLLSFLIKCPTDAPLNCNLVQKMFASINEIEFPNKWASVIKFLHRVEPTDRETLLNILSTSRLSSASLIEISTELSDVSPIVMWNFFTTLLCNRNFSAQNDDIDMIIQDMCTMYIRMAHRVHFHSVVESLYSFTSAQLPFKWTLLKGILDVAEGPIGLKDSAIPSRHLLLLSEITENLLPIIPRHFSHAMEVFKIILSRYEGISDSELSEIELDILRSFVVKIPSGKFFILVTQIFSNSTATKSALYLRLEMFIKRQVPSSDESIRYSSKLYDLLTSPETIVKFGDLTSFWSHTDFGDIRFSWLEQNRSKFTPAQTSAILAAILSSCDTLTDAVHVQSLMATLESKTIITQNITSAVGAGAKSVKPLSGSYMYCLLKLVKDMNITSLDMAWEALCVLFQMSDASDIQRVSCDLILAAKESMQTVVNSYAPNNLSCRNAFECAVNVLCTIGKYSASDLNVRKVSLSSTGLESVRTYKPTDRFRCTFPSAQLLTEIKNGDSTVV